MKERTAINISRILAVVCGVVCLALSYVASLLGGVLQAALSLFGMIAGPLLGLFTLGMMFPWANTYGAYAGLFSSLSFLFWIGIGAQIHKPPIQPTPPRVSTAGCNWSISTTTNYPVTATTTVTTIGTTIAGVTTQSPDYILYTVSYLWYSAIAVLTCVVIGMLVSFATGITNPKDLDPRVICPLMDVLCPFLPESWRKPFRFGIDHSKKARETIVENKVKNDKLMYYDNPIDKTNTGAVKGQENAVIENMSVGDSNLQLSTQPRSTCTAHIQRETSV